MIGRKLTARLVADGALAGRAISGLTLADVVSPAPVANASVLVLDLAAPGAPARAVTGRPDVSFHLAAVVSGEAEDDFDKGYRVNLDGARALFDAIRAGGPEYRPRVVFSSSMAAYGAPFPDAIGDEFVTTPLTSYGAQKVI